MISFLLAVVVGLLRDIMGGLFDGLYSFYSWVAFTLSLFVAAVWATLAIYILFLLVLFCRHLASLRPRIRFGMPTFRLGFGRVGRFLKWLRSVLGYVARPVFHLVFFVFLILVGPLVRRVYPAACRLYNLSLIHI